MHDYKHIGKQIIDTPNVVAIMVSTKKGQKKKFHPVTNKYGEEELEATPSTWTVRL